MRLLNTLYFSELDDPDKLQAKEDSFSTSLYHHLATKLRQTTSWLRYPYMGLWVLPGFKRYYEAFCAKQEQLSACKTKPSFKEHFYEANRVETNFNRFFSFVKHYDPVSQNYYLFYAKRVKDQQPDWQLFYVEGLSPNEIKNLKEMIADGCNWMGRVARGEQDEIFYKKTHRESNVKSGLVFTNLCDHILAETEYFSLPVLKYLRPAQLGKRLMIGAKSLWAMSHAGRLKRTISDLTGRKFPIWRVTTAAELNQDRLTIYDSFVERNSVVTLENPANGEVYQTDACESTFFLLGKNQSGAIGLWFRYIDYDALGHNPAIQAYTLLYRQYQLKLPMSYWKFVPLVDGVKPIGHIKAVQTGLCNESATCRIPSEYNTQQGIFEYSVKDQAWGFFPCQLNSTTLTLYQPHKGKCHRTLKAENTHWLGHWWPLVQCQAGELQNDHIPITMTNKSGVKTRCNLVRHRNMIVSFLGYPAESWTLEPDPVAKRNSILFAARKQYAVQLSLSEQQLTICVPNVINHTLKLHATA